MEMDLVFMNESSSQPICFTQQFFILSDTPECEDEEEDDKEGKYGAYFPGSLGNAKCLFEFVY